MYFISLVTSQKTVVTTVNLNVHYVHTGKGEHLLNGQGQVVQEHQSRAVSDQTYIFEVAGLLSGWYVLEVVLDGVPVGRARCL